MQSTQRTAGSLRLVLAVLLPISIFLTGCGGPDLIERMSRPQWGLCGTLVIVLDLVAIFDLFGDEVRGTMSKVLWVLLIIFFPVGGVVLYFLFGRG